jgi:hypothetical protein
MSGYLVDYGDTGIDLKFTGLEAGQQYGIWVYAQGDNNGAGRQMSLTVNGSLETLLTQPDTDTFQSGGNYVFVTPYADANGVIDLYGSKISGEGNINGVQLMAVPEPSPAMLLMAGAALLGGLAARRSRR